MPTRGLARAWFAVTAVAALLVQLVIVLGGDDGGPVAGVVRCLSSFTIESNILVAAVCGLLLLADRRLATARGTVPERA